MNGVSVCGIAHAGVDQPSVGHTRAGIVGEIR